MFSVPDKFGALDGTSRCRMSISKKMTMSNVSVTSVPPCHRSNLRHGHVSCHYLFFYSHVACHFSLMSHVDFKKSPCRLVEFGGHGP